MAWPLAWVVIIGTLPGILIGYYPRILYLPEPRAFKLFVGIVLLYLLYIGIRLLYELSERAQTRKTRSNELDKKILERARLIREQQRSRTPSGLPTDAVVRTITFNLKIVEYEFWGDRFRFSVPAMLLLAFVVGIIGGTYYGIGGFAGRYIGAPLQEYAPQQFIKRMLGIMITSLAISYIVQFFMT